MTQTLANSKLLHPAYSAGRLRPSLVLVTSEPVLPPPTSTPVTREDTASAPSLDEPTRLDETGAGVVARRHLALVNHPFQGAPE